MRLDLLKITVVSLCFVFLNPLILSGCKSNPWQDQDQKLTDEEAGIKREDVRRAFINSTPTIKKCYEDRLATKPGLGGKVVTRISFADDGIVRDAKIKSTTLKDEKVETCMLDHLRKQLFPTAPAGTVVEIDYPFVFESKKPKE